MSDYKNLKNKVIFKKYKVLRILGKGSFGCVFQGINLLDGSDVAIKVESKNAKCHLLEQESNYLSILKGYGIPSVKSYGKSGKFYVLVQELLGYNLTQIKKTIKFTVTDIALLAIQIIDRIEYIHSKYIIHRDIKPENFMVGYNNNSIIYIIDFGISRKYKSSRTGKHIKFSLTGKMFGTVRYLSYNGSRGVEQSRRDDLESIGYMLIYLFKGVLPWQGLKMNAENIKKKYLEMLYLKKFCSPEKICSPLPKEFAEYIKYCKKLTFEQDPNYEYLRNLFRKVLLDENNQIKELHFSWRNNKHFIPKQNSKQVTNIDNSKEKYINLLKRKQSPQTRLYRAIQNSLEKNSIKLKTEPKSELSCEQKNIFNKTKKININIHNRGVSEDGIVCMKKDKYNGFDNSNISRETITYNSLLAQYNMNVIGFQDENKIFELFHLRNKNRINKLSPDISKNIKHIKNHYNFDNKSTDNSATTIAKNSSNSLLNDKNSSELEKKVNLSVDFDKNYIENSNLYENKNLSYQIKNKKPIKNIENKRKTLCRNIYMNIIKKMNNHFDLLKKKNTVDSTDIQIEKISYDIEKYRKNNNQNNNQKNNKNINQNLINKFNSQEESFSFKNCPIDKNLKSKININQKIVNKTTIDKNNNILNTDINNDNRIFKKIKVNNAIKSTIIKNNNNKDNLNKNNISDDRRINIIINNNVNSFNGNSPNKINIINKAQNTKPINSYKTKYKYNLMINKDNTKNDEIIENDYNSYHYINKSPNNNYINQNAINQNVKQLNTKPIGLNYLYYNSNNKVFENNNKYINLPSNNSNKNINYKCIPKKRCSLKYKSENENEIEKSQSPQNKTNQNANGYNYLIRLNTYNNNTNSFIEKENSYVVGKVKVIKLNNNPKNVYKIRTSKFDRNNLLINNDNIIKNNLNNNINNNLHRNNFSNDINTYNPNKINLLNNQKIYLRTRKNIHQNLSPSPLHLKKISNSRFILEVKSVDQIRRKIPYSITSNETKKKIGLNYNNEDLKSFNHVPKNINKLNSKENNLSKPKCYNN